ncbi:MAG: penicillin-insensitive murein endopeptidase [Myxococcales bacterium]|nr:penicillin-insensitive murein endopeptidase [Myxococcales bacterium]
MAAWPADTLAKGEDCTHTVASGQTLGHIANRHGVSQRDLIESNPALKKNPDLLRVGQELDVCAAKALAKQRAKEAEGSVDASPKQESLPAKKRTRSCGSGGVIVEHEVDKGDTLGKITSKYAVTTKEVFRRNAWLAEPPHVLRVGQTVEICVDEHRAATSALCGHRTPVYEHSVVPGENLGSIAGRYGVRRADLERWNSRIRKNPHLLSVGQTVRVCPEIAPRQRTEVTYTVQPGDSFGEIAARHDLTRRELELFQRGKIEDTSSIRAGQTLRLWVDGGIVPGFGGIDDDSGVLKAGVQLPKGKHYHIKWETGAWGTSQTIRAIQTGIASYQTRMPGGPKVNIGDISKKGGGPFQPHRSHQHGRDVDIGYVLEGDDSGETRFRAASEKNLDVARTWRLIMSFIDTDQVVYVFVDYKLQKLLYEYAKEQRGASEEFLDEIFQYPRGRRRSHGIIRHWKGHVNHFHVRFRE